MDEIHSGGRVLFYGNAKGRWFYDGRICLSILFFENEKDAAAIAKAVTKEGAAYNGGWFDGMPCGRETGRDYTDKDGVKWYAVTC